MLFNLFVVTSYHMILHNVINVGIIILRVFTKILLLTMRGMSLGSTLNNNIVGVNGGAPHESIPFSDGLSFIAPTIPGVSMVCLCYDLSGLAPSPLLQLCLRFIALTYRRVVNCAQFWI